jgi:hypothetical protein
MPDGATKPTPRTRASAERELLQNRLYHLQDLKTWTLECAAATTRADALQDAIDHVQAAIDALERACQP